MRITIYLLAFFYFACPAYSQWHDQLWLFGYNTVPPAPDRSGNVVDFSTEPPSTYKQEKEVNFNVTGASICDSTGNLLLYTNGCYIANFAHLMVENGDSLNPGEISMNDCPGGLAIAQSHFFLPMPGHPSMYYLFHENLDYHDEFILARMPFFYTSINMEANNGLGKVLEKNVAIFDYPDRTFGTMTAVKHANGRDWWVVFPEKSKNRFYRFRFSPNGVEDTLVQELLPVYPNILSNAFTTFSPDGSKLARYEVTHGLYLYDFDRCTGLFGDNPVFIPLPGTSLGGGVSFSPDGRFVYLVSSTFILQADTWAADIAASLDTVAVYDGFTSPWPTTFFASQLGPDGRIYINTNNGTDILHFINYPNKKGDSCEVLQHGLKLAARNRFTSPHFPNYRLGPLDGSPCDTLGLDNHPLAGFRHAVDSSNSLRVIFTDNSFYQPTDWLWDFGDGSTSSLKDPLHKYASPGTYLVCLTVSNQYDSDTFC
ncbi:MAG: PKD domain-containing protein, partial [Chloroflexi bacterium]